MHLLLCRARTWTIIFDLQDLPMERALGAAFVFTCLMFISLLPL